jgi:hypothetical protein
MASKHIHAQQTQANPTKKNMTSKHKIASKQVSIRGQASKYNHDKSTRRTWRANTFMLGKHKQTQPKKI